jgi:alanine dehydrogenase
MEYLGRDTHIFTIQAFLTRPGEPRQDCRLVFSTLRNADSKFPVRFCTKDEFDGLREAIVTADSVDVRRPAIVAMGEDAKGPGCKYNVDLMDTATDFDSVFAGSRHYDEYFYIYQWFSQRMKAVDAEMAGRFPETNIWIDGDLRVIPGGDPDDIFMQRVYVAERRRIIAVTQSCIENIYERLYRHIDRKKPVSTEQVDAIEALMDAVAWHENGHFFDCDAGYDYVTMTTDSAVRDDYVKVLHMDRFLSKGTTPEMICDAFAHANMGGKGMKDFVRNFAGYFFYKFISGHPRNFVDSDGAVDEDGIKDVVRGFFLRRPYLKVFLGPADAARGIPDGIEIIANKVSEHFGLFYGPATAWHRQRFTGARALSSPGFSRAGFSALRVGAGSADTRLSGAATVAMGEGGEPGKDPTAVKAPIPPRAKEVLERIDAYLKRLDTIRISAREREGEAREKIRAVLTEVRSTIRANPGLLLAKPLTVGAWPEIKQGERRVVPIPDTVGVLNALGIGAVVGKGSGRTGEGAGSRFADVEYAEAGAAIVNSAKEVFALADIVMHVKELQEAEYALLMEAQRKKGAAITVYNFNHYGQCPKANPKRLTDNIDTGATFVSFENVVNSNGRKLILEGASEKAGVNAAYQSAQFYGSYVPEFGQVEPGIHAVNAEKTRLALEEYDNTNTPPVPGIDLTGIRAVIYGGGAVGYNQAFKLAAMKARVTIIEKDWARRKTLEHIFYEMGFDNVEVIGIEDAALIETKLRETQCGSTTAYQHGKKAKYLISKELLARIGTDKFFTVVDIDQGGGIEGAQDATSHEEPTYERNGNTFYCVPNIPAAVPRQTSIDISLSAMKQLIIMSLYGMENAARVCPELGYAVDVSGGRITNPIIQDEFPDIAEKYRLVTEKERMTKLESALASARSAVDAERERKAAPSVSTALEALPEGWSGNALDLAALFAGMRVLLDTSMPMESDTGLIFSEKVTFDNGFGVFLPKLIKYWPGKIAVVATTDRQRAMIEELNSGKRAEEKIVCRSSLEEAKSALSAPRCYYYKIAADKDEGRVGGVTQIDITDVVAKIVSILGKVTNISRDMNAMQGMYIAMRKFIDAAA